MSRAVRASADALGAGIAGTSCTARSKVVGQWHAVFIRPPRRVQSSGSVFFWRRNLVPLSRRWHSLQSARFSSTTISATCSPHASQMTTLATSFAIWNFLARDSWACLEFRPLRRLDSGSEYPFRNENNYVCQKRTCDPKLTVLTRRRSFPLGSRWRWCFFTQLRLRPTCSASLILTSTGARGAEPTGTRHRRASHTPHRSPLGVAASLSGLPLITGSIPGFLGSRVPETIGSTIP